MIYHRKRTAEERAEYAAYLRSAAWRARREAAMQRAAGICEFEEEGEWYNNGPIIRRCTAPAVHVHHRTYDRIFRELPEDLMAICDFHHTVAHVLERLPDCELCGGEIFGHDSDVIDFVRSSDLDDLEQILADMPRICDHCEHILDDD